MIVYARVRTRFLVGAVYVSDRDLLRWRAFFFLFFLKKLLLFFSFSEVGQLPGSVETYRETNVSSTQTSFRMRRKPYGLLIYGEGRGRGGHFVTSRGSRVDSCSVCVRAALDRRSILKEGL